MSVEPGSASERTMLAWERTALASLALFAAVIRVTASALPVTVAVAAGIALGVVGLIGGALAWRRARRLRWLGLSAGPLDPSIGRWVALVAVAVAAVGLAIGAFTDGLLVI